MDRQRTNGSGVRRLVAYVVVLLAVVLLASSAWRLAIQRVNLVIVNQSGAAATLTWQPGLLAGQEELEVNGCESLSIGLAGGQFWRLESETLDINSNFVERPWTAPMIEFEIWIDAGGSSRIVGPRAVDRPVAAPAPTGCMLTP